MKKEVSIDDIIYDDKYIVDKYLAERIVEGIIFFHSLYEERRCAVNGLIEFKKNLSKYFDYSPTIDKIAFLNKVYKLMHNVDSRLFRILHVTFDTRKLMRVKERCDMNSRSDEEYDTIKETYKYEDPIRKYYYPIADFDTGEVKIREIYSPEKLTQEQLDNDPRTLVNMSWTYDCSDIARKYDTQHKCSLFDHKPSKAEIYFSLCQRFLDYATEQKEDLDKHPSDYGFHEDEYRTYSRLYAMFKRKLLECMKGE